MIAQLTNSDKRTLIALFAILTLVQAIDIGQDYTNHQEADEDREQLKQLVDKNNDMIDRVNNISQKVIDKLNESGNRSIEFAKIHDEIMNDLESHMNQTNTTIQK